MSDSPLLLNAREVARELGISERMVFKLRAKGDLPKPVRMGRATRWHTETIREWAKNGCPKVA